MRIQSSAQWYMRNIAKDLLLTRLLLKALDYLERRTKQRLFGPLAPLVPGLEDIFDGPRNLKIFKADGDEFLRIYKEICGLEPNEKMLDVGCGIGRKTIPLTRYLTSSATYEGIDISKKGIEWCRQKISAQFLNFRFQQIDVYNKYYNPHGKLCPAEYKFPFDSDAFDFVVLGSVFTHMFPIDGANYLSEIHRVLRKGGRCLVTYFLLTEESLVALGDGKSSLDFKHAFENYRTVWRKMPEFAIAYDERWVRETYARIGLRIARLDYGSWYGRTGSRTYQDLILAIKE